MGLIESKGNMYSWVTHTWNTIKGECPHGCTYCYMKRWGKQKAVRFVDKELLEFDKDMVKIGEGQIIFVGSSCDLFAEDIPYDWIKRTLNQCKKYDNTYLFQTKNVIRLWDFHPLLPEKTKVCTTIETNRWYPEIMGRCPKPDERSGYLARFKDLIDCFITIEPIMDFDLEDMILLIRMCHPTKVNIGADSKYNHLPEPSKEKLLALIEELQKFTVIDQKRNLKRLL